ncbi:GGDEF domain-containing protein [Sporomusa termitida]|uniref:GGDEF: diguanylate cyclase (GGDEF) domain protein n=1 Tax=Sporomusa termitida TaxID=2377 RepID=A0A517DYR2_9FIRM|nr:GGDEF domain-containing protein [Sporomusa termitida]QDR82500.1 GGDEF: diguanylate cyclase (GGDEF) domain protein [Sporomusa termitida]
MAKLLSLIITLPFGLLVAAGIVYLALATESALFNMISNAAYAVYAVALLLSWWFNRSRVFFITTVIALTQYALSDLAAAAAGIPDFSAIIYPVVSLLLPVNIFIFSRLKERGIFNTWGCGRFGIIGFQLFYIALATVSHDQIFLGFFDKMAPAATAAVVTPLPSSAVLAYSLAFIISVGRQLKNRTHIDNAILTVLVTTMLGLHLHPQPLAIPVFFGAAAVMLIIAVIQDSYSMAYLDELTGLPARRALKEELMKLRGEYTIAMVDIDFFKKFNDTYGHDTGDDVLRLVASVLQKVTGGGRAFRYGGEEFTIVFPHTKAAEAVPFLEELRMAVEKTSYTYQGKKTKKTKRKSAGKKLFVTISIGVAERSEKNKQTQQVIKAADTALYRAKKKGRNCVSK